MSKLSEDFDYCHELVKKFGVQSVADQFISDYGDRISGILKSAEELCDLDLPDSLGTIAASYEEIGKLVKALAKDNRELRARNKEKMKLVADMARHVAELKSD